MLTYNQEEFIARTIESILIQQTNFRFQLVIGEDASTDKTLQICLKYQKENPEKIKVLPAKKNMGLIANFMRTLKECNGTYIAICDGDDYWTDSLKLQKQVDFLRENPDYKIIYTLKKDLLPDGTFNRSGQPIMPETTSFEDLVMGNYIPSVTVLFKNKTLQEQPPTWIINFPYGDWPLYLWTLIEGGKIKFLEEVTAAYRTEIGASFALRKKLSDEFKVNLEILRYAINDPQFAPVKPLLKKSRLHKLDALMKSYNREGSYGNAFKTFLRILYLNPSWKPIKMYFYSLKHSFN
tara:strand:+ start:93507 stop:94388 length:882 start_codon:yes stop_codon:yes gene_type:complete